MSEETHKQVQSLAEAQEVIARQETEIARLRRRLDDEHFADDLRAALTLAASAGTIAAPTTHSHLLEMIVATAAQVINARAAALFLIDEESQELIFEVALGQKAEEVKKFRVPLGHGIAGLVAVSGQPMAVADAHNDPRLAADIAQTVDYIPHNILCVPLFYQDHIIGVLELLDKEGAHTFSNDDIHALALFANQAAIAIEQSRTHGNLAALVAEVLEAYGGIPAHQKQVLQEAAPGFAAGMEEHASYTSAIELARLVQEIVRRGEHETNACRTILRGFADYLQTRPQAEAEWETFA